MDTRSWKGQLVLAAVAMLSIAAPPAATVHLSPTNPPS